MKRDLRRREAVRASEAERGGGRRRHGLAVARGWLIITDHAPADGIMSGWPERELEGGNGMSWLWLRVFARATAHGAVGGRRGARRARSEQCGRRGRQVGDTARSWGGR